MNADLKAEEPPPPASSGTPAGGGGCVKSLAIALSLIAVALLAGLAWLFTTPLHLKESKITRNGVEILFKNGPEFEAFSANASINAEAVWDLFQSTGSGPGDPRYMVVVNGRYLLLSRFPAWWDIDLAGWEYDDKTGTFSFRDYGFKIRLAQCLFK